MNICEKHGMTTIDIGCEKCIEEIVAGARNEGYNQAIKNVRMVLGALPVWDDDILWLKVDKKLEAFCKKVD